MLKYVFGVALATSLILTGNSRSFADCGTCDKTIVENAVATKDFSTLVAAVKAAGLVETLSGKGPFTVFAPTNEAFAKLPEGTVADLLKPENKKKLTAVLTYHVVAGQVMLRKLGTVAMFLEVVVQRRHIVFATEQVRRLAIEPQNVA